MPRPTPRKRAKMASPITETRAGKPAEIHADLSDIYHALQKIDMRLNMLNEERNLNSFALAMPAKDVPGNPPQQIPAFGRIAQCEATSQLHDAEISQLANRLSAIEWALTGEAKG